MIYKRLFDIIVALLGLIILFPILIIISALIMIRMKRPIMFYQERTGRFGKPFLIKKFRTMTLSHNGSTISISGEKRITSLGARLRRYKLDELPELWNVLVGEMSLVGPRPDVAEYTGKLQNEQLEILKLRPGITSPASLKYSTEEELLSSSTDPKDLYDNIIWPDKVKMNLDYCYHRTFFGDIMIILNTLRLRKPNSETDI